MKNNSKLLLSLLLMSGLTLGGCDHPGNSSSTSEQTPPTSDTNTGSGSSESSSSSSSSSSTPTPTVSVEIATPASTEIEVGKTLQLSATITNGTDGAKATWSTSDASIATVSADGLVTGVKAGKVTITAAYGGAADTIELTIKEAAPVLSVEIAAPASTEIEVGKTLQLTATVANGPTDAKATWTTSDAAIATVSAEGLVTGIKVGTVTITAAYGGVSDSIALTIKEPPVPTYAISVVADAGITTSLPEKSAAGKTVHFRLTYDAAKLTITSVKANGLACGLDPDGTYYFVMPETAVTVTITSTAVVSQTTTTIKNETAEVADIIGLGSTAVVGSTAEFYLVMKPGFTFDSLSIKSSGFIDAPVDYETKTVEGKTVYSFTVPSGEIVIHVNASRSSSKLTYDDEYIYNIYQTKVGSDTRESCNYDIAEFGADVEVQLRSTTTAKVKGIKIVETGLTVELKDGASSIHFTMPSRSITIEVLTEVYYRYFEVINSEHLSIQTFVEDENGEPTVVAGGKALAGETVYVKVNGVSDSVGINTLVMHNPEAEYSYQENVDLLEDGPNAEGYYTFEMPETDNGVTITVTEKDLTAFLGYPFVGSYLGDNICGTSASTGKTVGTSNYSFTIDGAGDFYRGSERTIVSATSTTGPGIAYLEEEGSDSDLFAYSSDGKIIFSHYNFGSLTSDDNLFAVKMQSPDDDPSLYTMDYEIFGNKSYVAVQYYRDGVEYAAAFVDYHGKTLNPHYNLDVDFEFLDGTTKITDTMAHYYVKDSEGNTLCEVSSTGTGGQNNRVILDGLQGTYAAAAGDTYNLGDLVLDGAGQATLGETISASYKVDESGNISITSGKDTYVISLDATAKTYTIVEHTVAENEFIGNTYSGQFIDGWDETNLASIVFYDASTCYFTITGPSGQPVYVPNTANQGIPQSYTISGSTITVNAKGQSGEDLTVTLTINDDGTLTIDGNVSSFYLTGGTVLAKQAA